MNDSLVSVTVADSTGRITLDRPSRRHAISRAMIAELRQALFDMHQQKSVRSVVLTATGDVFCAGMDLYEIHHSAGDPQADEQWHQDAESFRALLEAMLVFPKPIVAAINGSAHGGGVGLLLACDLVVAVESAMLSIPAPQRGLVAGLIAPLFAFRTSAGFASRYMLTGEPFAAAEAHRIGIVHELVVDQGALESQVAQLGRQFASGSFESIAMTKRLINEDIGAGLRAQLAAGAAMTATSKTTEAGREGVSAFVEKRLPHWR